MKYFIKHFMYLNNTMDKKKSNKRYGYRIKCCVPCCMAKRQDHLNRKYFKLPSPQQKVLYKLWIQKCQLEDDELQKKNIYVCQIHFDKSKILYNKLKKGTIPTLHLNSLSGYRSSSPYTKLLNIPKPYIEQRYDKDSVFDLMPEPCTKLFLENYIKQEDDPFEIHLNPKEFMNDSEFSSTNNDQEVHIKVEDDDSNLHLILKGLETNSRLDSSDIVTETGLNCSENCRKQKQLYENEILRLRSELSKKEIAIKKLKRNNYIKQTALGRAITILQEASSMQILKENCNESL